MAEVRVGFIGCGGHAGSCIYPSLAPAGLKLIATCDLQADRAEDYASRFGAQRHYTDYREMCAHEHLDAVLVVTGPQGHYQLALELVQAAYPVWTEKPPAPTAAQAEEVAAAAAQIGRHVQTGFNYRWTAGVRRALGMIESGEFAEPRAVAVRWWLGSEDGEHFVQHFLCHAVDLIAYLAGPLSNMHVKKAAGDGRFYYVITFDSPGGIATLEASNHMDVKGPWCRIDWMGRSGVLSCLGFEELELIPGGYWGKEAEPHFDCVRCWPPQGALPGSGETLHERWGYVAELHAFVATVRGESPPQATITEAAVAMRLAEQIVAIRNPG